MSADNPVHAAEDTEDLGNDQWLSYEGDDLPGYVKWLWVLSLLGFAWYTYRWYLPDLWSWMGWG